MEIKTYSGLYKHKVAELILGIQKTEFGIPITLEDQPDLTTIDDFYQSGSGNFWVALVDNQIVGTIALLDIGNRQGALRKMFVNSKYRGKSMGVGQQLLDNLCKWAVQKNFKEIFLGTTEKFIAAQRFYEKNGFLEIKKETLPIAFPVMPVDVKFYQYTLHK